MIKLNTQLNMEMVKAMDENCIFFAEYSEDFANACLMTPIGHPNIEYGWCTSKVVIDDREFELELVGEVPDDIINKIYFFDTVVGFRDDNGNIVSHIVFHPLTIWREPYRQILNHLKQGKPDITILIERIRTDDNLLNELILPYAFESPYAKILEERFNTSEDELKELKNYIIENKEIVLKEYPHLRVVVNAFLSG